MTGSARLDEQVRRQLVLLRGQPERLAALWSEIERGLVERGELVAMATSANFAGTPRTGAVAVPALADVSWTAPVNVGVLFTANVTTGSKVSEIDYQGAGTTLQGVINLFLFDGTNYWLRDSLWVPAITASTTSPPFQYTKPYTNLILAPGWSLRVTSTVAGQLVTVSAFGGDF